MAATLRGAMARQLLCCDIDGFSLHAALRVQAHERRRLEQPCRTITPPAFVDERIQLNSAVQVELNPAASGVQCEPQTVQRRPARMSWARLLKRVFDIDMQRCPNCSAREPKIIGAILERSVIERILSYLGLDPQLWRKGGGATRGRTSLLAPLTLSDSYRYGLRLPCSRACSARCIGKPLPTSG